MAVPDGGGAGARPAGTVEALRVGPMPTNCYIVDDGEGGAVVVDPGEEWPRIAAALGGRPVSLVLVTHAHRDHVGALAEAAAASSGGWCVGAPDAGAARAGDPAGARMLGMPAAPACPVAPRELRGGEVVRAGRLAFRAVACPGHSPGGMTYVEDSLGLAFTGDTLFAGAVGRTDLPGGDPSALPGSLARLAALPPETLVLPGHGRASAVGRELAGNPWLSNTAEL